MTKVSIITATWNCLDTIEDCLRSVRAQSWGSIEHIVIDGSSTDGTTEALWRHRDSLAVLVSERDNGVYDALNKGILRATGDVIGFLHADDVYSDSNSVQSVATKFADPTVDAVYGDLQYVMRRDVSKVVRRWKAGEFTARRLKWGWMPPHPTLYVRRKWYLAMGGFDTRYRIAADYHSILRLFGQKGFSSTYVPKVLVRMRLGGISNQSLRNLMRKSYEDFVALRETRVGACGGLGALLWKNMSKISQFIG